MRTTLFYALALFVSAGCSPSKYRIVEPKPQLSLSTVATVCELGQAVSLSLAVSQEGVDGNFSLSAFIRQGQAAITLDGSDMDTSGQWVQLSDRNARLVITPAQTGDLLVSFQAKSPDGEVSEQQDLKVTVTAPSEIAAEAVCEAKIVNPAADARIPVQLHIQGVPGADGKFIVTPTVSLGKGKIFLNGNAVNGQACPVDADVTFEYAPEEIGEQILEFEIAAGKASAKARAYMDVVKNIVVTSVVEGCFTIDGAGEQVRDGDARPRKRRPLQLRGRGLVRPIRAAPVRRGDLCAHTRARLHHRHPAQAQAPDCDHNPAGNCPDRISISRHGRRTSRTEGSLRLPHAVFGRLQGIRAGEVLLRGVQARHIEDPARRPEVRRDADDTQRGDEIDIPLALRRKILRLDTPRRQSGFQIPL